MGLSLSIKDVPEAVAERLRLRASRNHRSLQGELMAIIEEAALEPAAARGAADAVAGGTQNPVGWPSVRRGTKTIEQIAAEHRERYPKPFTGLPRAVDIIRADRDSR